MMTQYNQPRRPIKLRVRGGDSKPVQKRTGYSGASRAKRGWRPRAINEYQNREENTLKIIPLGGQEEVGRNLTIFEYGKDIVILDMGVQFPEEDMPGIDYIIPNIAYLQGKEKNIRAVIFSHGHLDHIGAAPILLEKLKSPPIIGRNLTVALIKNRMEDYAKKSAK